MSYNLILKQRRLDLNLSVQDVAIQTRLKPEYIRAIEENNLDLFSDDFSYVRYFVHGYCDAIGVNWNAIRDEVDANIKAYAAARDQALQAAQVKMIQSMPAAKPTRKTVRQTKRRRKKSFLTNSAGSLSRAMSWGQSNRLARLILIVTVSAVLVLFGVNALAENTARASAQAAQEARVQELKDKEEQTQKLADDLAARKSGSSTAASTSQAPASSLSLSQVGINWFQLSGLSASDAVVNFDITPAPGETVTIYWNDLPAYSQTLNSAASYQLSAGTSGTAVVVFDSANAANAISVQGTPIPADYSAMDDDGASRIVITLDYTTDTAAQDDAAQQEGALDEAYASPWYVEGQEEGTY